jgi:Dolichyl-phosphate-mannose-protein mannosyltransferase
LVNATEFRGRFALLLLAALVLTTAAWLRSAEYDEQYTLFLTAGTPRPNWPATVFPAGDVALVQAGHATLAGIARDLRATDVHPPLYFWTVSLWRLVFGPGLFATRMLSVLCGTVSIALVGIIAHRCAIRPAVAMLLTLGCYGFVYTNAIARGFAMVEMLTLFGVVFLLGGRQVLAGVCLGAACCCNYLAVFVGGAVLLVAEAWVAIPAVIPFLALDAWFFVAQHATRMGQFPPFAVWPSVVRLAEYQVAAVFGGLPLYVGGGWQGLGAVAVALVASVAVVRPRGSNQVVLAAAIAPPLGLFFLGAVFNTTPIELRYLTFGLPFVALSVAETLPMVGRSRFPGRLVFLTLLLSLQFVSIAGLLFSPRTMQPARIAASEAARLAGDAVVLVPAGNDGVGIVGAFGIEAPPALPILLIRPGDPISDRVAPYHRVGLALLAEDRDSTAAIAAARDIFTQPNWRRVEIGSNLEVYERGE